jgi:hypothetical protein
VREVLLTLDASLKRCLFIAVNLLTGAVSRSILTKGRACDMKVLKECGLNEAVSLLLDSSSSALSPLLPLLHGFTTTCSSLPGVEDVIIRKRS